MQHSTTVNNDDVFRAYQREVYRYRNEDTNQQQPTSSTATQQQEASEYRRTVSHAQYKSALIHYAYNYDTALSSNAPEDHDAMCMLNDRNLSDCNYVSNSAQLLKQRCAKMKSETPIRLEVTCDDLVQLPPFQLALEKRAIIKQDIVSPPMQQQQQQQQNNREGKSFVPQPVPRKKPTVSVEVQTDPVMEQTVYSNGNGTSNNRNYNRSNIETIDIQEDETEEQEDKRSEFKSALQLTMSNAQQGNNRSNNNNNNNNNTQVRNYSSNTGSDFKSNPVMYSIKKAIEADNKQNNKAAASNNTNSNNATGKKRKFNPPRALGEAENPKEETNQPAAKRAKTNNSAGSGSTKKNDDKAMTSTAFSVFPNGEIPEELMHLDAKLVESICHDILSRDSGITWDDIAGLEGPKKTIYEIIILPLQRPDLFYGARGPPRGVLLFGPPGTGKTLIAKAVATESKFTFFSISASSLTSKWIGEGEKLVRTLFELARYLQPSVIFIDEIDSLLSQRSDSDEDNGTKRIKTEFLIQLDGAKTDGTDRLLIIGATNLPQTIDEAVRRRLVKRIYIPLPDRPARLNLLKRTLQKSQISYNISEKDFNRILEWTEGYSGSDLSAFVTDAAWGPVRELSHKTLASIAPSDVRPVTLKDFKKARNNIRASVNMDEVKKFETWDEQFGCRYTEEKDDDESQDQID
jgi:SpoVK/Ycf46/Vps4 family AAA+-type ATPase